MSDEHGKKGGGAAHSGGGHGGGGGHGAPHEEHEEHEGAPEWLISFADNVTLMMGFFVVLLAMNMGPKGAAASSSQSPPSESTPPTAAGAPDMVDMAIAMREAFHNPVNVNAPKPGELIMVRRILEHRAHSEAEDEAARGDKEKVQSINRGDYHSLSGVVFFERQSNALTDRAKESLTDFAEHLRGLRLVVEVRGHASADEAFHMGDHGMRLSFDRALAVAQTLGASGLDWKQIRLVPCGDNDRIRPIAYDQQSHAQNERVEIVVTEETMAN